MMKSRLRITQILILIAVVTSILNIYMALQYLEAYERVIRTQIVATLQEVDLKPEEVRITLVINIRNPVSSPFTIYRVEYDLHLNGKYMTHDSITKALEITPNRDVMLERTVMIPPERMFTISEAIASGEWRWKVSGAAHITTFFGETIIRFASTMVLEPS